MFIHKHLIMTCFKNILRNYFLEFEFIRENVTQLPYVMGDSSQSDVLFWMGILKVNSRKLSRIIILVVRHATLHWENYISISFHIEWDMIVVAVFLSILNQMEFHLVQNQKEKLSPRSHPIECERKWKYSSLSVVKHNQIPIVRATSAYTVI